MRIACFSDVHGNLPALERVLHDLPRHAPDLVVNLGDWATGPLWPRETVELLLAEAIPSVRGNHDRWLLDPPPTLRSPSADFTRDELGHGHAATLLALPATWAPAAGVLAVHGTPSDDCSYLLETSEAGGPLTLAPAPILAERLGTTTATLVLCGHSHTQHLAMAPGGRLIVNPGSVGVPRHVENPATPIQEAGAPHARYAIATTTRHGWQVEFFALTYDWHAVAERARRHGREVWATRFLGR